MIAGLHVTSSSSRCFIVQAWRRAREARPTAMAVGIVMDGELVYAKTLGVRNVASNAPVDQDTVFRIASLR